MSSGDTAAPSARLVLLAVDSSKQALEAFEYYSNCLHKPDNEVILLHCPEMSNVTLRLLRDEKAPYEDWQKVWEEEQKKWKGLQEKFEKLLADRNMNGKFTAEPSHKPGEAIVRVAEEKKVNMIIMGTRGLGAVRRTIMGSVSDFVVHHAHCPVVVYRSKKEK